MLNDDEVGVAYESSFASKRLASVSQVPLMPKIDAVESYRNHYLIRSAHQLADAELGKPGPLSAIIGIHPPDRR